ncbi:MAG: transcriptional regulator, AraC family [Paenibacillaceae bacterium]|jgi:AraC-like DNA-binding protein|nr:transcriptional regulator, AraC family [Paenibacillaceae bacterium]
MLVKPMDLGPNAFFLKYRKEISRENWLMLHAHQGIELLYIHEGTGTVMLERQPYELGRDTLFCFQPFQLHKVDVPMKDGSTYVRTNLTFDPYILEPCLQQFPKLQAFLRRMAKGVLQRQVFTFGGDRSLDNLLYSYDKIQTRSGGAPDLEDQMLFLITLLRHLQMHVFEMDAGQPAYEKTTGHVERMLEWVEANFRQPFSLETLSRELHLSPYHISHLFKKHTGMTLSDYVASHRIREACALLANTNSSIAEIGRSVGGFSAPHFSQLFKKHKGITPNAYRDAVKHAYQ